MHAHLLLVCAVLSVGLYLSVKAIHVNGQSATVTVGEDAILFCQLIGTSDTLTRITWQRRTQKSSTNENIFVITPDGKTENVNGLGDRIEFVGNTQEFNGTIRIKNVISSDQQIYTCIFNIFPSGPFEKEIHLTVYVPPVVSVILDVTPVVGNSEVILATCTARSRPRSEVTWLLGALNSSVAIKTDVFEGPEDYYTVNSHLVGVPSKELNKQSVQCVVTHNSLEKAIVQPYVLVIHYPPQIVYIISVNPPTTHQEFLCIADANPKPQWFTWRRVNKTLVGRVDVDRLEILLSSDSNGLYMCSASNQYGNETGTIYMQISTESCFVCWSCFTSLLIGIIVGGLILICMYNKRCAIAHSPLQRIFRRSEHDPVPGSSPTSNRSENNKTSSL